MNDEIEKEVKNLPAKQQIALYFLLSNLSDSKKGFSSSKFLELMEKQLKIKDEEKVGKVMGGILSSLSRNGFIEKVSGGRDPVWRLDDEVINNAEEYKKSIFDVKTYWPEAKA